jgi:hypothetical protein
LRESELRDFNTLTEAYRVGDWFWRSLWIEKKILEMSDDRPRPTTNFGRLARFFEWREWDARDGEENAVKIGKKDCLWEAEGKMR